MNAPFTIARSTDLPAWADNVEARLLLSLIAADPPYLREVDCTIAYAYTYCGMPAAKLRKLFKLTHAAMYDALKDIDGGDWGRRFTDLRAYEQDFGPDAVIAKLVGDRPAQWCAL